MGVPGLFSWLLRKSKSLRMKSEIIKTDIYDEKIDYLLLDTNGLLHPCCAKVIDDFGNAGYDADELEVGV